MILLLTWFSYVLSFRGTTLSLKPIGGKNDERRHVWVIWIKATLLTPFSYLQCQCCGVESSCYFKHAHSRSAWQHNWNATSRNKHTRKAPLDRSLLRSTPSNRRPQFRSTRPLPGSSKPAISTESCDGKPVGTLMPIKQKTAQRTEEEDACQLHTRATKFCCKKTHAQVSQILAQRTCIKCHSLQGFVTSQIQGVDRNRLLIESD